MISIITPVLNESENIKTFLDGLSNLEGEFEVIFVDGGSTDDTIETLQRLKSDFLHDLKILTDRQGRGNQMNKGASIAKGNILLFLHVDSHIEKDSLIEIEKRLNSQSIRNVHNIIGGGFIHSFDDPDPFFKLSSNIGNLQARITRIFFGDFGIFIKKDVFDQMGGYDNISFLEDVEFCRRAKKFGRMEQIDSVLVTSSRRYYRKGKIKLTVVFIMACILNIIRFRPNFLYKYIVEM